MLNDLGAAIYVLFKFKLIQFLIFLYLLKAGNYSQLIVNFELEREVGHYIMDYYVPSIMLVVVSWVSFWLDPNAVPGRTTLGKFNCLKFTLANTHPHTYI